MVPHTLFLEPLSECMVLGLIASWAGAVLLRADYLTFFLFHTLTWSLADWIMLNIVQVSFLVHCLIAIINFFSCNSFKYKH